MLPAGAAGVPFFVACCLSFAEDIARACRSRLFHGSSKPMIHHCFLGDCTRRTLSLIACTPPSRTCSICLASLILVSRARVTRLRPRIYHRTQHGRRHEHCGASLRGCSRCMARSCLSLPPSRMSVVCCSGSAAGVLHGANLSNPRTA